MGFLDKAKAATAQSIASISSSEPGGRELYPSARTSDHSSATYRFGSLRFDGIFSSGQRVRITNRGYVSTTGSP